MVYEDISVIFDRGFRSNSDLSFSSVKLGLRNDNIVVLIWEFGFILMIFSEFKRRDIC